MDHAAGESSKRRSRFALTAVIALVAITAAAALRYYLPTAEAAESGNRAKLAKIVGAHRLARARLAGGFAYAPCQVNDSSPERLVRGLVCAGPEPKSWSSAAKLREFAGQLRIGGQSGSSSADMHTAGVWDLVWGKVDEAVVELREAVRREPLNARALNDLAVALTEFAERHDAPSALVDAFVAADSAVRADSALK